MGFEGRLIGRSKPKKVNKYKIIFMIKIQKKTGATSMLMLNINENNSK